jgi:ABC-type multidrug transport system ATPase subunit
LTGERFASDGTAYINRIPITQQVSVRRYVGYCPQFDALFDLLTGREHLAFYAMIKGLSGEVMKEQVHMLLKALSLDKYADRKAGTYSGGNKRKLSVAISMIGNPPVVLLDEPSCGMDPVSRRHMWKFISKTMSGRSVILTTHSMEECEALCHRLGIMVDGQLKCLGTPQHLKTRFGHGYQLDVTLERKTENPRDGAHKLESRLNEEFVARELEFTRNKATYELQKRGSGAQKSLSETFRFLEALKKELPIVAYALNQTTLEQIFIRMAKTQKALKINAEYDRLREEQTKKTEEYEE